MKIAYVIGAGMLAATLAAGCAEREPVDPCQVNPTKQAADGTWIEQDNEPMDADPCDADDLIEDGHKIIWPTYKPVQQKPAAPPKQPGNGAPRVPVNPPKPAKK